jgi:hypothetical protein
MIAPFEASKLKIERSGEHLQELERAAASYLEARPCVIVVEEFPGMGAMKTQSWNARIRKPVPLKFSALIGDVIHNLRTALDLLVCDLIKVRGKSAADVYFPFCQSADKLSDTIRKRHIHRAGPDVVRVIESFKPYRNGNNALRLIHDLDITDKHRALLPVLGAVSLPLGQIFKTGLPPSVGNWQSVIDHDGQMIIGTPDILGIPLGTELPARFFLALEIGPQVGYRELFEVLHSLAQETMRVFLALTALRPGAVFPIAGPKDGWP